jgi:uncharacterized protein (DUF305 family)
MYRSIRTFGLKAAIGVALASSQTTFASAADSMTGPPAMDCSKADAMMMAPHTDTAMPAMKPTGDVDKDFAQAMMAQHRAMVAMAKAEMTCGKDAKAKAAAQKQLDQAMADDEILHDLLKNDNKI